MTLTAFPTQTELFVPYIADLPLRNQHEVMERPFFSLSKTPRFKPIDYTSPDGKAWVRVSPGSDHPMATYYDLDILMGVISILIHHRNNRVNDISRTIRFFPQDLLRMIGRKTGGTEYQSFRAGLARLKATTITTNIRASGKRDRQEHRMFNWIDEFTDDTNRDATMSHGMTITLSNWLYEGAMMDGGVLKLSPQYFQIRGLYERWLYQVSRKHAGGAGEKGFKIQFSKLYEKSGSIAEYRSFKFAILKIVRLNELPDFHLQVDDDAKPDPMLHIHLRSAIPIDTSTIARPAAVPDQASPAPAAPRAVATDCGAEEIPLTIRDQLAKLCPQFLPSYLKREYDRHCREQGTLPLLYDGDFLDFALDFAKRKLANLPGQTFQPAAPVPHDLSDAAQQRFRREFPGRDIHFLERSFREWLKAKKQPDNYEAAFFAFAKTHAQRNPL